MKINKYDIVRTLIKLAIKQHCDDAHYISQQEYIDLITSDACEIVTIIDGWIDEAIKEDLERLAKKVYMNV